MKKFIRKWLGIDEIENKLNSILKLIQVDVDVHMKTDSWAVVSLAGKRDFVEFYRLQAKDIHEIKRFFHRFDRGQIGNIDCIYDKNILFGGLVDNMENGDE